MNAYMLKDYDTCTKDTFICVKDTFGRFLCQRGYAVDEKSPVYKSAKKNAEETAARIKRETAANEQFNQMITHSNTFELGLDPDTLINNDMFVDKLKELNPNYVGEINLKVIRFRHGEANCNVNGKHVCFKLYK